MRRGMRRQPKRRLCQDQPQGLIRVRARGACRWPLNRTAFMRLHIGYQIEPLVVQPPAIGYHFTPLRISVQFPSRTLRNRT